VAIALYRRYRPEAFSEMIGQSQVTEPLMAALRSNRVNHAYLFSGPRGCGKTTSARILARCLNCAEGPTDTPCGRCPSCVELGRDGGGSLDVVEIDAASHNGVDDARDLRERAVFAPARDRYKIFILDEAHMVTPQGFNALLKIVEEPPEHVKFIFATTEPDKVIGTIRSRTHHYPFRLIPPSMLLSYVQEILGSEGVQAEAGVLPLVVRAGGGSARDTLSVLDQLIAGSDDGRISYERATALLGYTHASLLDEVVTALAHRDGARAFAAIDRVVQTGQDPRRFVEDLLEHLRDLIVVAATGPDGAVAVLRSASRDDLDRLSAQASAFGAAELSRIADLANDTLTEMVGATSPRLHLELMIARMLVPAVDESARGALSRVERLERRIGIEGGASAASPRSGAVALEESLAAPEPPAVSEAARAPAAPAPAGAEPPEQVSTSAPVAESAGQDGAAARTRREAGEVTTEQMSNAWPEVIELLSGRARSAWMVASNATVLSLSGDVLTLAFPTLSMADQFKAASGPGRDVVEALRTAIIDVIGLRVRFLARVAGASAAAPAGAVEAPAAPSASSAAGSAEAPASSAAGEAGPDAPGAEAAAAPAAEAAAAPPAPSSAPQGSASAPRSPAASAPPAPAVSAAAVVPARARAVPEPGSAAHAAAVLVTEWETVAIPGSASATAEAEVLAEAAAPTTTVDGAEPASPEVTSQQSARSRPSAQGERSTQRPSSTDSPPSEPWADEPPFDEPPFDERSFEPPPEEAAPQAEDLGGPSAGFAPAAEPADIAAVLPPTVKYGEAVVREILGATFLAEERIAAAEPLRDQVPATEPSRADAPAGPEAEPPAGAPRPGSPSFGPEE